MSSVGINRISAKVLSCVLLKRPCQGKAMRPQGTSISGHKPTTNSAAWSKLLQTKGVAQVQTAPWQQAYRTGYRHVGLFPLLLLGSLQSTPQLDLMLRLAGQGLLHLSQASSLPPRLPGSPGTSDKQDRWQQCRNRQQAPNWEQEQS